MKNVSVLAKELINSGKFIEDQSIGQNRGKVIDDLNKWIGVPLGSSWCATFVCWLFKLSSDSGATGKGFFKTAGSQSLLAWGKKQGIISDNPQDLLKWKGAVLIRTDPGGQHGHVALALGRNTKKDKQGNLVITSIATAEGNSNSNGSSNGNAAVFHVRTVADLNNANWHYLNTSSFAGGSYWS